MDPKRWGDEAVNLDVIKPRAVVGLNGLYDLPTLIRDPGEKYAQLIPVYAEFTRGAFGEDEKVWREVSPVSVKDWVKEWGRPDGNPVLVQSKEDTLVPYRQLEDIMMALKESGVKVVEMGAAGDHDELWEKGDRLAEIVQEVVERM